MNIHDWAWETRLIVGVTGGAVVGSLIALAYSMDRLIKVLERIARALEERR